MYLDGLYLTLRYVSGVSLEVRILQHKIVKNKILICSVGVLYPSYYINI